MMHSLSSISTSRDHLFTSELSRSTSQLWLQRVPRVPKVAYGLWSWQVTSVSRLVVFLVVMVGVCIGVGTAVVS